MCHRPWIQILPDIPSQSRSKLFAKVFSKPLKSSLAGKELDSIFHVTCPYPEKSIREGPDAVGFFLLTYSTEGHTDLPQEAIGPSWGWSIPVFLRKPIATCDFLGWGPDPVPTVDLPMCVKCFLYNIHPFSILALHTSLGTLPFTPHKSLCMPLKCKIYLNIKKNGTFAPVKNIFWKIFENLNYL